MKISLDDVNPNEIKYDENDTPYGILLVDKPVGKTSHDIVDQMRKKYSTRRVGHAGTLDPFASGLLIILIGRATKLSNDLMGKDKVYEAEVLVGLDTDSGDIEGTILTEKANAEISLDEIEKVIKGFTPGYEQSVPVFSSVKVNGEKLRILARKFESFRVSKQESKIYFYKNSEIVKEVDLPKKEVLIPTIEVVSGITTADKEDFLLNNLASQEVHSFITNSKTITTFKLLIECSKGTYIRQLVKDIGEKLDLPLTLNNLRRIKIDDFDIKNSIKV